MKSLLTSRFGDNPYQRTGGIVRIEKMIENPGVHAAFLDEHWFALSASAGIHQC